MKQRDSHHDDLSSPHAGNYYLWARAGARAIFLFWIGLSWGCHSGRIVAPAQLPAQYQAAAQVAGQMIDLSAIARRTVVTDVIYPGDLLDVLVVTGLEKQVPAPFRLRVDDAGAVKVPSIGPVVVAGLPFTEAEVVLRDASIDRGIYRDPAISVALAQRQMDSVRIVGAVNKPGVYEIPTAGNDLLAALVAAGDLSEEAGTSIEIRHPAPLVSTASYGDQEEPGEQTLHVDLQQAVHGQVGDLRLHDGSVVMVHKKQAARIFVGGLVRKPDGYDMPADGPLRVWDAITLAGGRTVEMADKVHILRKPPEGLEPLVIQVSLRKAKTDPEMNVILAPGDVINVEETPATFTFGTIRNFMRFGFNTSIF